jgi:PIN domain nuclease of toxin-antitoxin system
MAIDKFLLDTHTFLWWVDGAENLSPKVRRAITKSENECYVSVASVWEAAIKSSIGKLKLGSSVEAFFTQHCSANQFKILDVGFRHAARTEALPPHHFDPFDRLLIAQSIEESMPIITKDKAFKRYDVSVFW